MRHTGIPFQSLIEMNRQLYMLGMITRLPEFLDKNSRWRKKSNGGLFNQIINLIGFRIAIHLGVSVMVFPE